MLSAGFRADRLSSLQSLRGFKIRIHSKPAHHFKDLTGQLRSHKRDGNLFSLSTGHHPKSPSSQLSLYPSAILAEIRWNRPVCSSNVHLAFTSKSSSKNKSRPAPKTSSGAQHFTYNTSTLIKNIKFIYLLGRGCMSLHMCGGQKTNLQY